MVAMSRAFFVALPATGSDTANAVRPAAVVPSQRLVPVIAAPVQTALLAWLFRGGENGDVLDVVTEADRDAALADHAAADGDA